MAWHKLTSSGGIEIPSPLEPLLNRINELMTKPNTSATRTVLLRSHIPINTGLNISMKMIVSGMLGFQRYGSAIRNPTILIS